MPVDLFHVSREVYNVGDTVPLSGDNRYWMKLMASPDKKGANERLESRRPEDKQCRRKTHFAFDNAYHCQYFGEGEYKGETLYYYKVGMASPTAGPMRLVDAIGKSDLAGSKLNALIAEYWNPTESWGFLEYMSSSMTILEILPAPTDTWEQIAASASWENDGKLAKIVIETIAKSDT